MNIISYYAVPSKRVGHGKKTYFKGFNISFTGELSSPYPLLVYNDSCAKEEETDSYLHDQHVKPF